MARVKQTSTIKKTPVTASIRYPACTNCGALKGDPCRTPGGKTRFPHEERETAAAYMGITPWWRS